MEMSADRMLGIFGLLGIVIGVGVAIAMHPKIKSAMLFAIRCFIFSGVALSLTVGIWAFDTDLSPMKRALVAGPLASQGGALDLCGNTLPRNCKHLHLFRGREAVSPLF